MKQEKGKRRERNGRRGKGRDGKSKEWERKGRREGEGGEIARKRENKHLLRLCYFLPHFIDSN